LWVSEVNSHFAECGVAFSFKRFTGLADKYRLLIYRNVKNTASGVRNLIYKSYTFYKPATFSGIFS